jgi:triacylglycerol lipase
MAKPIRKVKTFVGFPDFSHLFPPPKVGTHHYFEGGTSFSFTPNTPQHSHVNAWWMAEFSLLAYSERQQTEQILKSLFSTQKYSFFWLNSEGTALGNNTQGFGLETDNYVIIAFRGTEFPPPSTTFKAPRELLDIIADIRTDIEKLTPQTISEGTPTFDTPVHPGFAKALQSIWPQLQDRLTHFDTKPIWLTGHSLGGAIATLLAYLVPERVAALYTFGSPCVGTADFVQSFNSKGLQEKTFRYLHGNDAVAKALELFTSHYQHVGTLFTLDAGMRRGLITQMLNVLLGSTVGVNQLDHAPIFYSYECWNAIP